MTVERSRIYNGYGNGNGGPRHGQSAIFWEDGIWLNGNDKGHYGVIIGGVLWTVG